MRACCMLYHVLLPNLLHLQRGQARTKPAIETTQHTSVPLLGGPTARCVCMCAVCVCAVQRAGVDLFYSYCEPLSLHTVLLRYLHPVQE